MHISLKRTLVSGLFGYTLTMLASAASAQINEHFQLLDENGDGRLTGTELALLTPLAVQHSGRVDLNAFTAAVRAREIAHRAQWLMILEDRDGNKDGRLSGNELSGFESADFDKNGRINEKEYLESVREFYRTLSTLSPKAIAEKGHERFQMMDINADGRLSGTEATFLAASDLSGDQRITEQEYITAGILDVIAAGSDASDSVPEMETTPLGSLVQVINQQDSQALISLCRPEFQKLINTNVLTFLLTQIKDGNGQLSMPSNVTVTEGSQPGSQVLAAEIPAERGTLKMSAVVYEGKLLGIAMNGSSVDNAIPKLLTELMSDIDGKLTPFAKDCSPDCMRMIRRIQAGEDDVAISMFHPEIAKQVARETFVSLFEELRGMVGKYQKIELETAAVDMDAAGTGGFITLTHRVEGTSGVALVQHKLQIVGFKPHMVVIAVEPSSDR